MKPQSLSIDGRKCEIRTVAVASARPPALSRSCVRARGSTGVALLVGPRRRRQQHATCQAVGDKDGPTSPRLVATGRLHDPQVIGADHGEGFMHFRLSGDALRVDVDALNEQLRHHGLMRLRHAMRPDEAFGMIFNFDGCVADTGAVRLEAWRQVALARGLPLPAGGLPLSLLARASPEQIMVNVLRWAHSRKEAVELCVELSEASAALLSTLAAPQPGVREWLDALTSFQVPCALISSLDRATLQRSLERMALHDHFDCLVTAEDEVETISQRLLSAAIKLRRPPNQCVVFEATPEGVTAAHNCTMKAVAVAGEYHPHHLKAADVTVCSLAELTVYNVRRLFAQAGSEFMDLQRATSSAREDGGTGRRRRTHVGVV